MACVNCLQPKSDKYVFIRLSQRNLLGIFPITKSKTKGVCQKKGRFLKKVVLAKEVSGRTVQLDEIREIIFIVSRVAQHRKVFWGVLFLTK